MAVTAAVMIVAMASVISGLVCVNTGDPVFMTASSAAAMPWPAAVAAGIRFRFHGL
ncbi:hypothetical protein [Streptomyces hygroscopicus]|uniref:hypothetical protein n=1 Tax=Streptomyces hygroscopicus TaxID=1912 RepID=UPI00340F9949